MPRTKDPFSVSLIRDRSINAWRLKYTCPVEHKLVRPMIGRLDQMSERAANAERDKTVTELRSGAYVVRRRKQLGLDAVQCELQADTWADAIEPYLTELVGGNYRETTMENVTSRLNVCERALTTFKPLDLPLGEVFRRDSLIALQQRLFRNAKTGGQIRSPATVNSLLEELGRFQKWCHQNHLIDRVVNIAPLSAPERSKGRPVFGEEYATYLETLRHEFGDAAPAWEFLCDIVQASAMRLDDVMHFSWDRPRTIRPDFSGRYPEIVFPAAMNKNNKDQTVVMPPALLALLSEIPEDRRVGWVVNPWLSRLQVDHFRPLDSRLVELVRMFSNRAIAEACGVSDVMVGKWLRAAGIHRPARIHTSTTRRLGKLSRIDRGRWRCWFDGRFIYLGTDEKLARRQYDAMKSGSISVSREGIPADLIRTMRDEAAAVAMRWPQLGDPENRIAVKTVCGRLSKVGRLAGIVVKRADHTANGKPVYASLHDFRRGFAARMYYDDEQLGKLEPEARQEIIMHLGRWANWKTIKDYYLGNNNNDRIADALYAKTA